MLCSSHWWWLVGGHITCCQRGPPDGGCRCRASWGRRGARHGGARRGVAGGWARLEGRHHWPQRSLALRHSLRRHGRLECGRHGRHDWWGALLRLRPLCAGHVAVIWLRFRSIGMHCSVFDSNELERRVSVCIVCRFLHHGDKRGAPSPWQHLDALKWLLPCRAVCSAVRVLFLASCAQFTLPLCEHPCTIKTTSTPSPTRSD